MARTKKQKPDPPPLWTPPARGYYTGDPGPDGPVRPPGPPPRNIPATAAGARRIEAERALRAAERATERAERAAERAERAAERIERAAERIERATERVEPATQGAGGHTAERTAERVG